MVTGHSWKRFDPRPRSSSPYTPIEEHFDSRVYELWERDRGNEPRCESSRRLSSVHGSRSWFILNVAERIELIRFRETVGKNITRIYIYIYISYLRDNEDHTWSFSIRIVYRTIIPDERIVLSPKKIADILEKIQIHESYKYRINTNSYLRSKICRFVNGGIGKQRVSMVSVLRANRWGAVTSNNLDLLGRKEGKE